MKSTSEIRVGLLAYGAIGEGSTVKLSLMGGAVMVNKANVVTADIMADNGVVHDLLTVTGCNGMNNNDSSDLSLKTSGTETIISYCFYY